MSIKKVTVVYPYFAHYREPVFNALNDISDSLDVEYVADSEANLPSLKTISFNEKFIFTRVKNIWLGRWLWQHGLFTHLIRSKPDAIIFLGQFNIVSTWVNAIFFKMMGTKIYFWGHGYYGNESGLKKVIRTQFNRIADIHLLYGNYAKELLVGLGINRRKLKVIYNSLDCEQQNKVLSTLSSESVLKVRCDLFDGRPESPLLVFIGRLMPVKELNLIIESLHILSKKGRFCNCLIVGSGPEYERLRNLAFSYGVSSQIHFFGECHDEVVLGELIYSADICVSPGNVGLTAMHSLSYGTPVITHDNFSCQMPEFEAITHNVTGSFYKYGSIESLVDCITYWVDLPQGKKEQASKECIKVIGRYYNPKKQAELIGEALDTLI